MTYQDVFNMIKLALTGRPEGTKVQVVDHEDAEIMILDYIEQLKAQSTGTIVREAHASAISGVNCNLVWNIPFANTNYTFTYNGYDAKGNPVEIYIINKSSTKIVVKTLVNATLHAISIPYGGLIA